MTTHLIQHTPLNVTSHAARTCWQSFGKSDNGGVKDLELIDRVGNKLKHSSTLEHAVWSFTTESENLRKLFAENKFSDVTTVKKVFVISTNIRAVQGLGLPPEVLNEILPEEYKYLFSELCCYPILDDNRKPLPVGLLLFSSDLEAVKTIDPEGYLQHLTYTFYITDLSRAVLQQLVRHRQASPSVKSSRYTLKELKDIPTIEVDDFVLIGKYCVLTGEPLVDKYIALALVNLQTLIKSGVPNDKAKYAMPDAYRTEGVWSIKASSIINLLQVRGAKSALWEIRGLAALLYANIPKSHQHLFSDYLKS